ncbi:MAG: O-antigen ligase family protein [Chloroflexi bacterium]|nr:O-antigen ligase family protein [Chloroflexota bacterium]
MSFGSTVQQREDQMRGTVAPLSTVDLPFRGPRLGVNAELTRYTPAELVDQLTSMRAIAVHWVRQFFRWDVVAVEDGSFDWSAYDPIVAAFDREHDIELVAVLIGSPLWERDPRATKADSAPPASPEAFAAFASAFAERYGNIIDVYQIWDEPNLGSAWGGLDPQPADYLAILSAAYRAIHEVDPGAEVITAALAPTVEQGGQNLSDWRYLEALYRLDGGAFFDAVAGKPYGFDSSPEDRLVSEDHLNFSRIVGLREVMLRYDDGHKPLWASQFGWNSLPSSWAGSPSIWGSTASEQQVAFTLGALERIDHEWPWMSGALIQHWQPIEGCDDPVWGFALIDCSGVPREMYSALESTPTVSAAGIGLHAPASPYANYSGVWTFSPLGADIGWIQDSSLSFAFEGTDIGLVLREDDYLAFLYVWVDDQPANALPIDASGHAYITLTSGSRSAELDVVPVATGLAQGTHTVTVVADRGWDRWALAGFAVGNGDPSTPFDRTLLVAGLTSLVGLLGFAAAFRPMNRSAVARTTSSFWQLLSEVGQIVVSLLSAFGLMLGMLLSFGDGLPNLFRREPVQVGIAVLSAGIAYLQPHTILLMASLVVLAWSLYHQPRNGILLTLFFAPFFLFPVELVRFAFPMSELVLLITVAAASLHGFVRWSQTWRGGKQALSISLARATGLDLAFVAWVGLAAISLLWAAERARAMTELRVLFVEPFLFYVLVRVMGHDRQFVVRIVITLLTAGVIVSLIGLGLFIAGQSIITAEDGAMRLAGVYGSPNNVALFLGRCLPFALAFALLAADRRVKAASAAASVLYALTILLTQSAGALLLGLPVSVTVVLLLTFGRRGWFAVAGMGVIGAGALAIALRSARFQRLLDFTQGTNFFRLRVWESATNMIADHPIAGLGLDQFLYAYRGSYIRPDAWQEPNLSHPHNILLDLWIRLGIVGVLIFALMQLYFWRWARLLLKALPRRDRLLSIVVIGAVGSMANLLAHGLVDNSIFVNDLSYVFVLLLSIISNIRAIDAEAGTVV